MRFTHVYQRSSGPILRTVYADGDRVMVAFEGEQPYVESITWTSGEAANRVEEQRRSIVDADHAWALRIDAAIRAGAR